MQVILSYSPEQISITDFSQSEGKEVLRKQGWLWQSITKHLTNDTLLKQVCFLGRDDKRRIEIAMPLYLFDLLKNEPLFVMNSDALRRLRCSGARSLIEYVASPRICAPFDNDLDLITETN